MGVVTYLHREGGVRATVFSNRVTPSDLARLGRMFTNPDVFDPDHIAFSIFEPSVTLADIEPEDLIDLEGAITDAFAEGGKRRTIKVAVVASNPGVTSEMKLWREITKPNTLFKYHYESFPTLEEAVEWQGLAPEWAERIRTREGFAVAG